MQPSHNPRLEIRHTTNKGRGVFALEPIPRGARVAICSGQLLHTDELQPHHFAMQVGGDLWLCSDGEQVDDCFNHSCEPKVGFVTGEPVLYALREIQPGEEICWDYSTSLSEPGWCLECRCGSPQCRGLVRSFGELTPTEQERLRPIALRYLRGDG